MEFGSKNLLLQNGIGGRLNKYTMAIHFKRNMFWCWRNDEITKSIIGFASKYRKFIFDFRDKISTSISNDKQLIIQRYEGQPTKMDSTFRLFDKNDKENIQLFFSKKMPSSFPAIFKTKYYRDWQEEWSGIIRLAKVKIETSHDFSGLMIDSVVHSPDELSDEINKVSNELNLQLYKNKKLENINIYLNRTFD